MDEPPVIDDAPLADPAEVRRAMEFYASRGWTDGLPVVPVTASYLAEFLADHGPGAVGRGPADAAPEPGADRAAGGDQRGPGRLPARVLPGRAGGLGLVPRRRRGVAGDLAVDHRHGAVHGGERAGADRDRAELAGQPVRAPGSGPTRRSGGRSGSARSTRSASGRTCSTRPPRAPRPSTPAASPRTRRTPPGRRCTWTTGFAPADSACTSTVIRSVLHIEARHTIVPEQLAADLADSIVPHRRDGARRSRPVYVVLNPEHARLLDSRGWSKQDLRQAIIERGLADLPGAGGVGQGGDRQGHRLAAARRPPGRASRRGAGRPGHAGPAPPLGRRRAGRGGGRAQRGGVVGRGDVRLLSAARWRSSRSKSKTDRVSNGPVTEMIVLTSGVTTVDQPTDEENA